MINLSKKVLEFSIRNVHLSCLDKAVNYICDIKFKNGETVRGKLIKKPVEDIKIDYSGLYYYLYRPFYNSKGELLIKQSVSPYVLISLDESKIYNIKAHGQNADLMNHDATVTNTLAIESVTIVNDFKAKVTTFEDTIELLHLSNLRLKIATIDREIPGCLFKTEIGEEFLDCEGNAFGAAYHYIFAFNNRVPGAGTFAYMQPSAFDKTHRFGGYIEYIRRD